MGVMLADLPQAEQQALRMAEALRAAGAAFDRAGRGLPGLGRGAERRRRAHADATIHDAATRLVEHLTQVESAGAAAALRVQEAGDVTNAGIDALLARAADSLSEIRSGIDAQAATVAALLDQAQAGLGRAGIEASQALSQRLDGAGASLDALTARIAEQERASQRLVADLDTGLVALDDRFARLAEQGDERAGRLSGHVGRLRADLDSLGVDTGRAGPVAARARRPHRRAARRGRRRLSLAVAQELGGAFGEAEAGASRLLAATDQARPSIEWMQGAANDTAERLARRAARGRGERAAAERDAGRGRPWRVGRAGAARRAHRRDRHRQ